jgi:hypothetical protein
MQRGGAVRAAAAAIAQVHCHSPPPLSRIPAAARRFDAIAARRGGAVCAAAISNVCVEEREKERELPLSAAAVDVCLEEVLSAPLPRLGTAGREKERGCLASLLLPCLFLFFLLIFFSIFC